VNTLTGKPAPEFSALASSRDGGAQQELLAKRDFRGRPLILAFYPADWSPVCGDQMALYNAVLPEFERRGAALLGISVDGPFCHQAFAHDRDIRFPLLADFEPKGKIARDFDVYRAADGTTERALFVLDGEGIVRWSYVSPINVNPGADGILRALESLGGKGLNEDAADGFSASEAIAAVNLVEFGDYECPHCRKAHPIVKQLQERFGDRLKLHFRNFPIRQLHPHAMHAAEAAVSVHANAGDKAFWAMHDTIFAHQRDGFNALDDEHLARYADEVGADGAQVRSDLDTERFAESVTTEFMEGVRAGVNGTPTFFIDGERFDGDWRNLEAFADAIEQATSKAPVTTS